MNDNNEPKSPATPVIFGGGRPGGKTYEFFREVHGFEPTPQQLRILLSKDPPVIWTGNPLRHVPETTFSQSNVIKERWLASIENVLFGELTNVKRDEP